MDKALGLAALLGVLLTKAVILDQIRHPVHRGELTDRSAAIGRRARRSVPPPIVVP
jgi:hypothetical protein